MYRSSADAIPEGGSVVELGAVPVAVPVAVTVVADPGPSGSGCEVADAGRNGAMAKTTPANAVPSAPVSVRKPLRLVGGWCGALVSTVRAG
jgi:hypothetical protein